jgi:arginyl-tRNA synthetase
MQIDKLIAEELSKAVNKLYGADINPGNIQIQNTRKEFEGDYTAIVFPITKLSKQSPEKTGGELGQYLKDNLSLVQDYNVIKGFLNLSIVHSYWLGILGQAIADCTYGTQLAGDGSPCVMVEYSSPNTNKPLHLGHIRNNLLGYSIARILEACGNKVIKANLINDRGIHICKSMVAWQLFGNGETPESTGKKGDHLVGEYYVRFEKEYRQQISELVSKGMPEDEAKNSAPLMQAARQSLLLWEAGDKATVEVWKNMNSWVYKGFDITYKRMGVEFDKFYYESDTYLLGKQIVLEGLEKSVLYQKEDGSIWADLEADGLDHKLLLRPDGTSVYMTQDIGTAVQRFREYGSMSELVYVVGNEQNYHFQVLALILKKLGYQWADKIYHLSYGMVELPEGKMKSREGKVVDADDLMDEMQKTSEDISAELGKLDGYSPEEARHVHEIVAQGALKYFILKVDPAKNMLFNPSESIDFNGNTGPFIQYTYARINSIREKAVAEGISLDADLSMQNPSAKEIALIKSISRFPAAVTEAGNEHNPGLIANYVYDLVKEYNQFYHDMPILKEPCQETKKFRLALSAKTGQIIKTGMSLLGIDVPERM